MSTDARRAADLERRRLARLHHPDLGGDPERFVAAMAGWEAEQRAAASAARTAVSTTSVRRSLRGRTSSLVRRGPRALARHVAGRLPRSLPGARRYGRL